MYFAQSTQAEQLPDRCALGSGSSYGESQRVLVVAAEYLKEIIVLHSAVYRVQLYRQLYAGKFLLIDAEL